MKKLKKEIEKGDAERFEIDDSNHNFFEVYDSKGFLLKRYCPITDGQPFYGNDNPKFKEGEIVEIYDFDQVRLGFITAVPADSALVKKRNWNLDHSDNVYLVDFSKDTNEHDHPEEYKINKPRFEVSLEKETELKDAYNFISKKVSTAKV